MNSLHLTPDQIDDHLIGDLAPEAAGHLALCDDCQAMVAEAEAPLASFREVSLAWAERRSATMPLRPAAAGRKNHRLAWASLTAAATAGLAVGIVLPLLHHPAASTPALNRASSERGPIQTVAPLSASADEIARDNQMLDAIDRELAAPVGRPGGTDSLQHRTHARSNLFHG